MFVATRVLLLPTRSAAILPTGVVYPAALPLCRYILFFIILPAKKKKSMANYKRDLIQFIPRFAPLLALKKNQKKLQFCIIKRTAVFAAAVPELYAQRYIT